MGQEEKLQSPSGFPETAPPRMAREGTTPTGSVIRDLPGRVRHKGGAIEPLGLEDFHVYMTASGPRGVIHVGMSGDLPNRA